MKRLIRILLAATIALGATLGAMSAHAQRAFNQAELDTLLAESPYHTVFNQFLKGQPAFSS